MVDRNWSLITLKSMFLHVLSETELFPLKASSQCCQLIQLVSLDGNSPLMVSLYPRKPRAIWRRKSYSSTQLERIQKTSSCTERRPWRAVLGQSMIHFFLPLYLPPQASFPSDVRLQSLILVSLLSCLSLSQGPISRHEVH